MYYTPDSDREKEILDFWFDSLIESDTSRIGGARAVKFFLESSLSRDVLREVWAVAECQSVPGSIDRPGFYSAMRLICILLHVDFAGYYPHPDLFSKTQGRRFDLPLMTGHPPLSTNTMFTSEFTSDTAPAQEDDDDFGDFASHPTTPNATPTPGPATTDASTSLTPTRAGEQPMATAAAAMVSPMDLMMEDLSAGLSDGLRRQAAPMNELLSTVVSGGYIERENSSSSCSSINTGTGAEPSNSVDIIMSPAMAALDRMSAFDDLVSDRGIGGDEGEGEDWDDFADAPEPQLESSTQTTQLPSVLSSPNGNTAIDLGTLLSSLPDSSPVSGGGASGVGTHGADRTDNNNDDDDDDEVDDDEDDMEFDDFQASPMPGNASTPTLTPSAMVGEPTSSGISDSGDDDRKKGEIEDFEYDDFQASPVPQAQSMFAPSPSEAHSAESVSEPASTALPDVGLLDTTHVVVFNAAIDCDDFIGTEPEPKPELEDPFAFLMNPQIERAPAPVVIKTVRGSHDDAAEEDEWDDFDDFQASPVKSMAELGLTPRKLLSLVATLFRRYKYESALLCVRLVASMGETGAMNLHAVDTEAGALWQKQYDKEMDSADSLLNTDDSIDDLLESLQGISEEAARSFRSSNDVDAAMTTCLDLVKQLHADDDDDDDDEHVDVLKLAVALECELRSLAQAKRCLRFRAALLTTHQSLPEAWSSMLEGLQMALAKADSCREDWIGLSPVERDAVLTNARFIAFTRGVAALHDMSVWLTASCREGGVEAEHAEDTLAAAVQGLQSWPSAREHCVLDADGGPDDVLELGLNQCLRATEVGLAGAVNVRPFCNLTLRPVDSAMAEVLSDCCARFYRANVNQVLPETRGFLCF